jgi:hypothetical protein
MQKAIRSNAVPARDCGIQRVEQRKKMFAARWYMKNFLAAKLGSNAPSLRTTAQPLRVKKPQQYDTAKKLPLNSVSQRTTARITLADKHTAWVRLQFFSAGHRSIVKLMPSQINGKFPCILSGSITLHPGSRFTNAVSDPHEN